MPSELQPGFLVAAPSLLDPNFQGSVVLLTAHKPEGSLGFVINRASPMSFRDVATELGVDEDLEIPEVPVLTGGPVAPETGWLIYDPSTKIGDPGDNVLEVSDNLHVSTSRELLEHIAKEPSANRHVLILGYSGWGAGQLDEEIKQGAWIPVDLEERIVFETPVDDRYVATLATLGINPLQIVGMPISEA